MSQRFPTRNALALFVSLAVCFAVAGAGGLVTSRGLVSWYPTLAKPAWNPPNWVFGPVWTVLYATMAVAAWLVWRRAGLRGGRIALGLFGAQLALNLAWPAVFFGLRQPGAAFVEIVVLWLAIAATLAAFDRVSRPSGWLLAPYLLWVTFAAGLNFAIWRLNA